ncbi:MAG: hypothetical protein FH759_12005 [Sediminimonas qiaohouensis]|uniref:UPF0102 protein FH759_12005 n=1 Tax=Sediminimonas qiaohouensis TaxID=552061 RepID=A0A7C9MAA7_9RHOB|nr:YraN family protein [Sediminimonas qiaohouensis]MTJ05401.1 hypothetical protein [Sediminimonas qiaohouensis]
MSVHFDPGAAVAAPIARRRERGRRAYLSGCAAEERVMEAYQSSGMRVAARRWRGGGGEIDLVMRAGDRLIFVEVKAARDFDTAARSLGAAQMRRIRTAASVYADREADGELTDMRFDAALVNGRGEIRIVENAFVDF